MYSRKIRHWLLHVWYSGSTLVLYRAPSCVQRKVLKENYYRRYFIYYMLTLLVVGILRWLRQPPIHRVICQRSEGYLGFPMVCINDLDEKEFLGLSLDKSLVVMVKNFAVYIPCCNGGVWLEGVVFARLPVSKRLSITYVVVWPWGPFIKQRSWFNWKVASWEETCLRVWAQGPPTYEGSRKPVHHHTNHLHDNNYYKACRENYDFAGRRRSSDRLWTTTCEWVLLIIRRGVKPRKWGSALSTLCSGQSWVTVRWNRRGSNFVRGGAPAITIIMITIGPL